ncbi:MAG: hypothetical protein IKB07_04740 [Lachnospiraceae bacterium]|nr:hypothetical protein [Lachnospiraceae bacterium]
MTKKIGFVGCYSHDIILMLAKGIRCLGKRVLITDRNIKRTLAASVPIPEGLSAKEDTIEYDGVFFSEQRESEKERDSYDVEIIDYGLQVEREEIGEEIELFLITDMLLHHVRYFTEQNLPEHQVRVCILRDASEQICRKEKYIKDFLQAFPNRIEFFLPPDVRDVTNRYVCEAIHEYWIRRASPEMQDMVYKLMSLICPDYTEREIRRCVRTQERR